MKTLGALVLLFRNRVGRSYYCAGETGNVYVTDPSTSKYYLIRADKPIQLPLPAGGSTSMVMFVVEDLEPHFEAFREKTVGVPVEDLLRLIEHLDLTFMVGAQLFQISKCGSASTVKPRTIYHHIQSVNTDPVPAAFHFSVDVDVSPSWGEVEDERTFIGAPPTPPAFSHERETDTLRRMLLDATESELPQLLERLEMLNSPILPPTSTPPAWDGGGTFCSEE